MELTPAAIKRASGHFDLSCVTHLDLSRAGVSCLAHLDACAALVELCLVGNALASLDGLPPLASLRTLRLGENRLTTLDDLPALPELEELDVAANAIAALDVSALARKLPQLRTLDLQRNPVATAGLADDLRRALPDLLLFNGELLALARPDAAARSAGQIAAAVRASAAETEPGDARGPPALDVGTFVARETRRLEDLLAQCEALALSANPRAAAGSQ